MWRSCVLLLFAMNLADKRTIMQLHGEVPCIAKGAWDPVIGAF